MGLLLSLMMCSMTLVYGVYKYSDMVTFNDTKYQSTVIADGHDPDMVLDYKESSLDWAFMITLQEKYFSEELIDPDIFTMSGKVMRKELGEKTVGTKINFHQCSMEEAMAKFQKISWHIESAVNDNKFV